MLAVAGMDTKRSEGRPPQQFPNRFWVHASNLPRSGHFLNADLDWRRLAEMRGVRGVGGEIVEHRVDRGRDRLELRKAGKDRAIADLAIDYEGRALSDLQRMKFRRGRAGSRFDFRGARSLQ